jgi:hypothetical protein
MIIPIHRWFRFRLRTLLIVISLAGGVLGWRQYTLQVIQKRAELLDWVASHGGAYAQVQPNQRAYVGGLSKAKSRIIGMRAARKQSATAGTPWLRFPYGDHRIAIIEVPGVWRFQTEIAQIHQMFPEAMVDVGGDR